MWLNLHVNYFYNCHVIDSSKIAQNIFEIELFPVTQNFHHLLVHKISKSKKENFEEIFKEENNAFLSNAPKI